MKASPSLNVRFIAMSALMVMASACSTVQPLPVTAKVSPALLVSPPPLPKVQRSDTGTMSGEQAHYSLLALYDVAGQIRATLIALQAEARMVQAGQARAGAD